jgi:hypothetical protein
MFMHDIRILAHNIFMIVQLSFECNVHMVGIETIFSGLSSRNFFAGINYVNARYPNPCP